MGLSVGPGPCSGRPERPPVKPPRAVFLVGALVCEVKNGLRAGLGFLWWLVCQGNHSSKFAFCIIIDLKLLQPKNMSSLLSLKAAPWYVPSCPRGGRGLTQMLRVSYSCCDRSPELSGLKQYIFIPLRFWRLEIHTEPYKTEIVMSAGPAPSEALGRIGWPPLASREGLCPSHRCPLLHLQNW